MKTFQNSLPEHRSSRQFYSQIIAVITTTIMLIVVYFILAFEARALHPNSCKNGTVFIASHSSADVVNVLTIFKVGNA
mgnify:CR=1